MPAAHPVAASSLLLLALLGGQATAQEARAWLERMNRAVEDLNYRGTFVHVLDGTAETLHIVHRNADGQSGERILSMDGVGREIVRQGDRVQGIFPDRRIVLFETRSDVSPLVSALPSNTAELEPHYEITLGGSARVAERVVQVLEIKPRDEFRYGYMLWLDQETAMPLQSQLIDEQGQVVEQILFTEIEVPADIPAAALEPTIDTTGFTTLRAAGVGAARGRDSLARGGGARWLQAVGCDAESRSQAPTLPSSISSTPTVSRPCRCSSRIRRPRPRSVKASPRSAAPTRTR